MSAPAAVTPGSVGRALGIRVRPALAVEVALLGTVLGAAIVLRLIGLADHTDASDEGIRGIQLRLLAAGFEPVSEIYSSQGPLSL